MRKTLILIVGAIVLVGAVAFAFLGRSEALPPANAMPLSAIIKSLEDQGLGRIEEVYFEHDVWEVELHQADNTELELHIDPLTGKILKRE